ncbi:MAG: YraN family protein [Candidatus Competibacterales bacterium]
MASPPSPSSSSRGLSPRQVRGRAVEWAACQRLTRCGLQLLEANYRCPWGELDLVMKDGETWVFVEVRSRRRSSFASAVESIDEAKQRRLVATAQHYLASRGIEEPCRFDVVAVDLPHSGQNPEDGHWVWIRDAFQTP